MPSANPVLAFKCPPELIRRWREARPSGVNWKFVEQLLDEHDDRVLNASFMEHLPEAHRLWLQARAAHSGMPLGQVAASMLSRVISEEMRRSFNAEEGPSS